MIIFSLFPTCVCAGLPSTYMISLLRMWCSPISVWWCNSSGRKSAHWQQFHRCNNNCSTEMILLRFWGHAGKSQGWKPQILSAVDDGGENTHLGSLRLICEMFSTWFKVAATQWPAYFSFLISKFTQMVYSNYDNTVKSEVHTGFLACKLVCTEIFIGTWQH